MLHQNKADGNHCAHLLVEASISNKLVGRLESPVTVLSDPGSKIFLHPTRAIQPCWKRVKNSQECALRSA